MSLSCPLNVSIITSECCFLGNPFSSFTFSREWTIISSKNLMDFRVRDQLFMVKLTKKVAVTCRLSSTLLIETFFKTLKLLNFKPLKLKVYFPGDTYDKRVWLIFKTNESRISWRNTAVDTALWKVNFSSAKNCDEGSTLPVVPLSLG